MGFRGGREGLVAQRAFVVGSDGRLGFHQAAYGRESFGVAVDREEGVEHLVRELEPGSLQSRISSPPLPIAFRERLRDSWRCTATDEVSSRAHHPARSAHLHVLVPTDLEHSRRRCSSSSGGSSNLGSSFRARPLLRRRLPLLALPLDRSPLNSSSLYRLPVRTLLLLFLGNLRRGVRTRRGRVESCLAGRHCCSRGEVVCEDGVARGVLCSSSPRQK